MKFFPELKKSFVIALWFMLLTFPILVIRVNTIENIVVWRWINLALIGIAAFVLSFLWQLYLKHKTAAAPDAAAHQSALVRRMSDPKFYRPFLLLIGILALVFPFVASHYQINIMPTALIYVMLGLGLNIVVGLAGLLDLGYVAFYAVGAYFYALMNHHFGLGFWVALPLAGLLAATFGILLGFPVLRLRGDYLAIVTLGFGEIIRLILENWNEFSFGPSGIAGISRPTTFGFELSLHEHTVYLYYIMIALVLLTIVVVGRLRNSRIGRAWIALREDEIACQAMGIDKTRTKLTAFALGATWAGMAGVFFAAQNTYVNPKSFTFLESAIILCIVVLGGMGSIIGVIIAALVLILLPEYLRVLADYRMLVFGAILMAMMIFRPQGIMATMRRRYTLKRSTVA
jgi:branched-chain amino acid transport system permease protein